MKKTQELRDAVERAIAYAKAQEGAREAEAFASANDQRIVRLNYTSHLPCNGVQEPKSVGNFGLGIQVVFERDGRKLIGFGSDPGDLTIEGAKRAFEKARLTAVEDPDFHSLPALGTSAPGTEGHCDPRLMSLPEENLVALGWDTLSGALDEYEKTGSLRDAVARDPAALALVVGGDVIALRERMAVFSTGMERVLSDESALILSSVSAMIESHGAKGSGWRVASSLESFHSDAGREAAGASVRVMDGVRIEAGDYPAVLGPQPMADLFNNIIVPSLRLDTLYTGGSAFQKKLGLQVAADSFNLVDDGATPGLAGTKGYTCEGFPTGATKLITNGVMTGVLSNHYEYQRTLNNPRSMELLGQDPRAWKEALYPRNGFRFGMGGGRSFSTPPSIASTNLRVSGDTAADLEELIKPIERGIYIGRIWYTYPMNGLAPADFTSTVIADSFLIENGRISRPLAANTLRVHDNAKRLLMDITGYSNRIRPVVVWAADEVVYSPDVAVGSLHVEPIGEFLTT